MKSDMLALAGLAASAYAAPQGVTEPISPDGSAPAGCSPSYDGEFNIAVTAAGNTKRDVLTLTLSDGVLKDAEGRTGYIADNYQFQFDAPAQTGAIYTAGFSACDDGALALGSKKTWYRCQSGDFYNLYDRKWAPQCEAVTITIVGSGGSTGGGSGGDGGVSQIGDGQPQAPTGIITQIGDGQPQAPSGVVTQIGDGQPQAPTGVVSQIPDGQPQAPTGVVSQIPDGQPQAPTGVVSQIPDGQPQAPTGVVTQIPDGQPQAPTGVVTQIPDGQPQAPTDAPAPPPAVNTTVPTPAPVPGSSSKVLPGTAAALFVGLLATLFL